MTKPLLLLIFEGRAGDVTCFDLSFQDAALMWEGEEASKVSLLVSAACVTASSFMNLAMQSAFGMNKTALTAAVSSISFTTTLKWERLSIST